MSRALLDQYTQDRDSLVAFVTRTLDGVEGRDLNEAETKTVNDAKGKIDGLNTQIRSLTDFYGAVDAGADLTKRFAGAEKRHKTQTAETRSIGEQFIESEQFRSYMGRGQMPQVEIETRALPHTLASIADVLPPKARVDITPATAPTPLLGLIPTITVSQNGIETVVWAEVAGGAAVVAEGELKPPVEYGPTVVPYTLDTIAVFTQMTRQMIEDAPAVRDKINSFMAASVTAKMESEAAAAMVAATLPTATSDTLLKAIRVGIGTVQAAGFEPNGVVLNPADWADLDVAMLDIPNGQGAVRSRSFWGLTPVAASSQPAGTATVGDFSQGVERYSRSGVALYITDSHGDTFLKNVFTLLSEARAKTIVTRPDALVECSATP